MGQIGGAVVRCRATATFTMDIETRMGEWNGIRFLVSVTYVRVPNFFSLFNVEARAVSSSFFWEI